MTIEKEPFYETKKYFGSISIPELCKHDITFSIEKWTDTSYDPKQEGYEIHISVKDDNFIPFRGKNRGIIHNKIKEQMRLQNIVL